MKWGVPAYIWSIRTKASRVVAKKASAGAILIGVPALFLLLDLGCDKGFAT